MSEGIREPSIEVPGDSKKRKPKKYLIIAAAAVVIVVIVILAVIMSPQYSPLASIHDADGDGVTDDEDAFINNPDEWLDTDGDEVGDNTDEFPNNDEEWEDADGDGYGDNGDIFPSDPDEWLDTDSDGVGDNADAFPTDSTQWADRDGDGHGDNPLGIDPDAFPDNPAEWTDSDSDGVGDNSDFYDMGNGKIRISIDEYQGDGTADLLSDGDPFFDIRIDTNDDGFTDFQGVSVVFTDDELLTSPYFVIVDIADGLAFFAFSIHVYDSDLEGDYIIDYTPSSSSNYYIHTVYSPFTESWSFNGSDDGLGETDCILEYSLSITT